MPQGVTGHTFTKGASASLASRRAISVLPHPVGPIMRMFLGTISSCNIKQHTQKKKPEQICRADFRSRHYHLRQKMLVRINYAAHAGLKQSRYVVQVSEQIPNPTESYTCCHTSQESLCLPKLMSCFFRTAEG